MLCASGHIQTLVCPRGSAKSRYLTSGSQTSGSQTDADRPDDPEVWRAGAEEHEGSWWDHWTAWLEGRSGELVAAPEQLGSATHPAGDDAPGRYVLD